MLIPLVLALLGADYLAPRNLVAAMIPLTRDDRGDPRRAPARAGAGMALAALIALAFLATQRRCRSQPAPAARRLARARAALRGGWLARAAGRRAPPQTAITTVELGAAPLEYYLPPLHNLPRDTRCACARSTRPATLPLRARRRHAAGARAFTWLRTRTSTA